MRRLIAAVGVAAFLAVGAAPRQPYVKSITCDLLRGKYTNCQVTLWDRHQSRYVTYPVSDKRNVFCFDPKLTDCVLRVWHPRLDRYRSGKRTCPVASKTSASTRPEPRAQRWVVPAGRTA